MSYPFTVADVAYLRSAAGQDAVAALGERPLTAQTRIADVAAARALAGDRYAAALETAVLQRKAAVKLPGAGWLATDAALQQASAAPVARHRAARLAGRTVHDVTCSIGADLAALGVGALGSDLDPVRLAMARHNCPDATLLRADALTPTSRADTVFADPARRDGTGRRTWRPEDLAPPLHALAGAYRGRDLVVKCAPGLDFAAAEFADEIEVTSLDRQVREACLWTGSVATQGIRRRATVLSSGGPAWSVTDAEPDDCGVRAADTWLVDPDPAVVRAGLVRHYACRHGLAQLDPHIAYLTGPAPPPGARAFRVLDTARFAEKTLRAQLRGRGVGRVEILVRGLAVDPDVLRRRLKPAGDAAATVVLTRIGDTPTAFVCAAS